MVVAQSVVAGGKAAYACCGTVICQRSYGPDARGSGGGKGKADRLLGNDETLRSIILGSKFRQSGRMMQLHAFNFALCTCRAWICTAILGKAGRTGLLWCCGNALVWWREAI